MTDLESSTHTLCDNYSDDFEENTVKVNSNLKPGKSKVSLKPPWVPAPGNSSIPSGTLKPSLKVAQTISRDCDCDCDPNVVDLDPAVKRSKSARELRVLQKPVHTVAVVHSNSAHQQNQSHNSQQRKKSRYKRPSGGSSGRGRSVDKNNNDNCTELGKMSDLTLKSKDSLLDVTQTLQEKREQVMALWNVSSYKDQQDKVIFIRELEKANKLAIEASEEVEHLRNSIKRLQEKPQLSLEDSKQLEDLRTNVLLKLKSFEEVNSVVGTMFKAQKKAQEKKAETQESGENISSSSSTDCTTNSTDGFSSNPEIITIKKVNPNFAQNPSGNSNENVEKITHIILPADNCEDKNLAQDLPQKVECAESKSDFSMDLDKLNKLYGEIYTFESPAQIIMKNRVKSSKSQSKAPTIKSHYSSNKASYGKSTKNQDLQASDSEELSEIDEEQSFEYEKPDRKCSKKSYNYNSNYKGHSRSRYYRSKLASVQDKLSQTEDKVDQLSKSLHRIESQSEFDIKMLKTNIQDKLEELEPMPELLYMAEKKMSETQKHKQSIEKKLKTKNKELMREKAKVELLEFELKKMSLSQVQGGSRSRPRNFDRNDDDFKIIQKLKKVNNQLKKDLRDRERQLDDEFRCKDQVVDLQRELGESRREILRLKEDKEREIQFMGKRIDDLVDQLNESRKRNRMLAKQLHIIRTSYHDIFPEFTTTGTTGNGSTGS